jgi:multiple sugar transport system permease protein
VAFLQSKNQRERWFYLLISPWLVGFLLLQAGPMLAALVLAFFDWPLSGFPAFVGVTHFRTLLQDDLLARVLWNSCYYAVGSVPLSLAVGLALAILVNRRQRGIAFFRTIFFLPVVASGVALTLLWAWLLNPRYGLLNRLLALVGISGPVWLYDERWAMPSLILMSVWLAGVNMLIYLAALQNIPAESLAAAELDGANRVQQLRYVVWPLLSPVTFYLLVVNLIGALQSFTPTYVLTKGGPHNATLTLPLYLYFNAFAWARPGYAAALSLLMIVIIAALTAIQVRLVGRWVFYRGGVT